MFSLDWVQNKAQVMGSAHLINDYVEHGDVLDKEVCPVSLILLNSHRYPCYAQIRAVCCALAEQRGEAAVSGVLVFKRPSVGTEAFP